MRVANCYAVASALHVGAELLRTTEARSHRGSHVKFVSHITMSLIKVISLAKHPPRLQTPLPLHPFLNWAIT